MLDSTHLRFFTEETLERMFARCGWRVVERDDFETSHTDQYDEALNDQLPLELVGALRTMAGSLNPNSSVQQFVWALKPFSVKSPPETFLQAVSRDDGGDGSAVSAEATSEMHRYLSTVGLLAAEQSRRGRATYHYVPEFAQSDALPAWKQRALSLAYRSPRSSAAFQKLYRRLR
jgi:hypothetical protein